MQYLFEAPSRFFTQSVRFSSFYTIFYHYYVYQICLQAKQLPDISHWYTTSQNNRLVGKDIPPLVIMQGQ